MTEPNFDQPGRRSDRTGRPVLAVGWPLGFQALVESGEVPDEPYQVQLGGEFLALPENVYRLWTLAFGGVTRQELLAAARSDGIAGAEENAAALLRERALIELEDDPLANSGLLEDLRLCRVGMGLGNSPEAPNQFKIGLAGLGVRAVVDFRVFGVWSLSDGSLSIAEACRRLAASLSRPDEPIHPASVLGQVAVNLRLLLREGVAHLDLR